MARAGFGRQILSPQFNQYLYHSFISGVQGSLLVFIIYLYLTSSSAESSC